MKFRVVFLMNLRNWEGKLLFIEIKSVKYEIMLCYTTKNSLRGQCFENHKQTNKFCLLMSRCYWAVRSDFLLVVFGFFIFCTVYCTVVQLLYSLQNWRCWEFWFRLVLYLWQFQPFVVAACMHAQPGLLFYVV